MRNPFLLMLLASACLFAQSVSLTDQEKEFQDSMQGVILEGQSTHDGKPGVADDKYNIEKVVKTGDDQWTFYARVEMKGQAMTIPLPLQVKWAGDTPVITLTSQALPGLGSYTARVLIYHGQYAGTWSGKSGGGKVFGRVVKSTEAKSTEAKSSEDRK
jgi:hypothetical protein